LSSHLLTPSEQLEEFSGDVPFEAASDLPRGLTFGQAAGRIVSGGSMAVQSSRDHRMKSAVELTVAAAVQTVPLHLS